MVRMQPVAERPDMTEAQPGRAVRFDRRRAMIPVAASGRGGVPRHQQERTYGALALALAGLVLLLAAALGYGYLKYAEQQETLATLAASPSVGSAGDRATAGAMQALQSERDQIAAALGLARQRIAALQAELGAPSTGQAGLPEPLDVAPGGAADITLDALKLEVRLLKRERDAARAQIDRLINGRDHLQSELARVRAQLADAMPATTQQDGR